MRTERDRLLRVAAVLLGLLATSDFTKALQHLAGPKMLGIVVFGVRAEGTLGNLLFGPLLGLFLAAYSYGLWHQKRWIIPISIIYAFYVPTNLVLFWFLQTGPQPMPVIGMVAYLMVSLPGSIGTALYVAYHNDQLT